MRESLLESMWTSNSFDNGYKRNRINDLGTVCVDVTTMSTTVSSSETNYIDNFLGTYGDIDSALSYSTMLSHEYTKDAMRVACKSPNEGVVRKARLLLSDLSWSLAMLKYNNADLSDLPSLSPGSMVQLL